MCKSVEVVHKLHTVVHILPEVEGLANGRAYAETTWLCALTEIYSSLNTVVVPLKVMACMYHWNRDLH